MTGEHRVVITPFRAVDRGKQFVPMQPGTILDVASEPDSWGLVNVRCVQCGKDLRVFSSDLIERTKIDTSVTPH